MHSGGGANFALRTLGPLYPCHDHHGRSILSAASRNGNEAVPLN